MQKIDPKNLMALERAVASLLGIAISFIVLGFVVQKFELFLRLIAYEINANTKNLPLPSMIQHYYLYQYLGIMIVVAGIIVAIYSYFYYLKWIELLQKGEIDSDKKVYFYISLFIALIGIILVFLMSI